MFIMILLLTDTENTLELDRKCHSQSLRNPLNTVKGDGIIFLRT